MGDEIVVTFQMTKKEAWRGAKQVNGFRFRREIMMAVALLLFALSLLGPLGWLTGVTTFLCLYALFKFYIQPALRYRGAPVPEETRAAFSRAGVTVNAAKGQGSYEWPTFTGCVNSRDFFLLKSGRRSGVLIPKRALTPEDADRLYALINECLKAAQADRPEAPTAG